MPYVIGVLVGLGTSAFLRIAGFDRDRAVYPTIVIVVAAYYVLFAAMGGGGMALILEIAGLVGFASVAVLGFRTSPWWIVAALAGHGAFDSVHHRLIANPGVPSWWPAFCLAADVGLAGWLAGLLLARRRGSPSAEQGA